MLFFYLPTDQKIWENCFNIQSTHYIKILSSLSVIIYYIILVYSNSNIYYYSNIGNTLQ